MENSSSALAGKVKFDPASLAAIVTEALLSGMIAFVWISLPFLSSLVSEHLYFVGILASIAIFSSLIFRIFLRFYSERGRTDLIPAMSLFILGISLAIMYISLTFSLMIVSMVIVGASMSLRFYGYKVNYQQVHQLQPFGNLYSNGAAGTIGIIMILLVSALYVGNSIRGLIGIYSIIALLVGMVSLSIRLSRKASEEFMGTKTSLVEIIKYPLSYLKSFDTLSNRRLALRILMSLLLMYVPIAMAGAFLSSIGYVDNVSRTDIFLIFASFAVLAFLIEKSVRILNAQIIRETFYLLRPSILLIAMLLLSMAPMSLLFVSAYALIILWIWADSMSSGIFPKYLLDSDILKIPYMQAVFSVPLSFTAPLLGSLLWYVSPRLLFGVALAPVAIAIVLTFINPEGRFIARDSVSKNQT
ncbi:MAG: hypothetical protein QXV22_02470 [Thermoplasmataceae archaeon]